MTHTDLPAAMLRDTERIVASVDSECYRDVGRILWVLFERGLGRAIEYGVFMVHYDFAHIDQSGDERIGDSLCTGASNANELDQSLTGARTRKEIENFIDAARAETVWLPDLPSVISMLANPDNPVHFEHFSGYDVPPDFMREVTLYEMQQRLPWMRQLNIEEEPTDD